MIQINYQATDSYIVIIGANSVIAAAVIEPLLQMGATVFGMDIQPNSSFQDHDDFYYFEGSPIDTDKMSAFEEQVLNRTSYVTGLINLSGTLASFKTFEEMTAEEWQNTFDISFKSCYNSCKTFASLLRQAKLASIVNMSSGLAFGGQRNYGPYTNAKAAVVSLTKTLATELASNIRVNSLAPGAVDTNFIYKEDGTTRVNMDAYKSIVPLGTVGKPSEIAAVILFLLSDGAAHITGQCVHVNGGALMV